MPKTRSTGRSVAATPPALASQASSSSPKDDQALSPLRRSTRLRASVTPYSPYTFSGRRVSAPRPGERPNTSTNNTPRTSANTTPEAEPAQVQVQVQVQVQFLLRACAHCRKRIVHEGNAPPSREVEKQLRDKHLAECEA